MKENMTEHEITENLSRVWMQFKQQKDSLEAEKVGLHPFTLHSWIDFYIRCF